MGTVGSEVLREHAVAAVREVHEARNEAWRHRDGDSYLGYYAEDATIFLVRQVFTRAEFAQRITSMLASGGGALAVEFPPLEDITVSIAGDAATTSYAWRQRIRYQDGAEANLMSYETDVWYLRDGAWKLVRAHITRMET